MALQLSKYTAWAITLAAIGGALLLSRRKGSIPSLLGSKTYYPEYDMKDDENLPLGYHSNNPLNIRYNAANNWQGKILPPATGKYGQYERFRDLVYGYRAALALLRGNAYIGNGLNTIRKIITRWAPENDHNYTDSYISNVSRMTGIDPDAVITRNDKDMLTAIVYAMSIVENGQTAATRAAGLPSMEIINEAWNKL
jgi:hypothetical protein